MSSSEAKASRRLVAALAFLVFPSRAYDAARPDQFSLRSGFRAAARE
jgi:hypothetical protein